MIEKYLGNSGNGAQIGIQVADGDGQDHGVRQFVVTVTDAGSGGSDGRSRGTPGTPGTGQDTAATGQTAGAGAGGNVGAAPDVSNALMYTGTVQYVPKAGDAAAPAPVPANEYDAYWASQPPAVQTLRNLPTVEERTAKAQELTAQGYSVDVPIMVWQWDPLKTMQAREQAGYTWVPSAGNAPVQVGPGIDFPGSPTYDPAAPPPGAIQVSTDFAKGLENTSIWWRNGGGAVPESSIALSDAAAA